MNLTKLYKFLPLCVFLVSNNVIADDFQSAAKLLSAARRGDTNTVQQLINDGVDINYVDSTGMSLVCTAVMNNDTRAIQLLQMYGADASKCDKQIKNYKNKLNKSVNGDDGGFFSGLDSSHVLALSAAGVAAAVGGLAVMTDLFDPDNGNSNSGGSSGSRGQGGGDNDKKTPTFSTFYGPAMIGSDGKLDTTYNYDEELNYYSSTDEIIKNGIIKDNYTLMTASGSNYLLMMYGYSPFARGYFGQRTLRNGSTGMPLYLGDGENTYKIENTLVTGGKPINVALISSNGINAKTDTSLGEYDETQKLWNVKLYSTLNGNSVNAASSNMVYSKYYNNDLNVTVQNAVSGDVVREDKILLSSFDLSDSGTTIHNAGASGYDNLLAKVIVGETSGYTNADYVGFLPNGQLTVYKTGGGKKYVTVADGDKQAVGTYKKEDSKFTSLTLGDFTADEITSFGIMPLGTSTDNTVYDYGFTATDTDDNKSMVYTGYIGLDNLLYIVNGKKIIKVATKNIDTKSNKITIDSTEYDIENFDSTNNTFITKINGVSYAGVIGDTIIDLTSIDFIVLPSAYSMDESGSLILAKQQQNTNYKNYIALNNALTLTDTKNKSKVDVIANSSVIPTLYNNDTATLSDVLEFSDKQSDLQTNFYKLVHNYYDTQIESTENEIANFYKKLSISNAIAVFSTGRFVDNATHTTAVKEATFENAAPLIFDGIQNNFVSVVAVGMNGNGTADYVGSDISAYAPSNKITLSAWSQDTDMNGTPEYYKSRICGVAGSGVSDSVNPWCFASAGMTDELAVSSAAAAIGVVKSAFGDAPKFIGNENQYVLSLLALTADGPYLATDSDGNAFNVSTDSSTGVKTYAVAEYLRNKYLLPNQYQYSWTTDAEYLGKFKEVYGYGLINLERALTPSKNVYFYNGKYIVSNKGNAYWRSASNTMLNLSGAFNLGQQTIKTSYYDVLSSSDLTFQLPRVWTDEISLGTNNKRGLYMGDVLGEFNVDTQRHTMQKIGKNIEFDMQISERAYNDKYNGLDRLHFGYAENNITLDFDYQHKFTNGESRFNGRANGILSLASNTLSSNFAYKVGQFEFGGSAFSGNITDDNLLENDPTISAQFESARLGFVNGGSMNIGYSNHNLQFDMSAGIMNESDTILGTYTGGLLSLSGGKTQYVDGSIKYSFADNINVFVRGTFGNTTTDVMNGIITNISDLRSNAFAIGLDINNFNITVSEPLAITNGKMEYGYADYIITENSFGNYDLTITNAHTENIDLSVDKREFRLNSSYKYALTDFTDAGLGLIYRVNPNNTDDFGNETILMFKLHHRLGI